MTELVLGTAGSGKTHYTFQKISQLLNDGIGEIMLITPEQFSFESERMLIKNCGAQSSEKVEVFSFSSLACEIFRNFGGQAGKPLDEPARLILIAKALASLAGELKFYKGYEKSSGFISKIATAIAEFKQYRISNDDLKKLSNGLPDKRLAFKLYDLSLILATHDALLIDMYTDPLDSISLAAEKCKGKNFFANKTLFFDSFKGFTEPQFLIIDHIISDCENVHFNFCTSSDKINDELGVFANVNKTMMRITEISKLHNKKVSQKVLVPKKHGANEEIDFLCRVAGEITDEIWTDETSFVTMCTAENKKCELEFVAAKILKKIREQGYRFKDFCIISRDTAPYNNILKSVFFKNNIPVFFDDKCSVENLPLMVFVLSAISAINFNTEKILRLIKTGFFSIENDEVFLLENYTFLWSINGNDWLNDWTKSPYGYENGTMTEELIKEELKKINAIRRRILLPLQQFNKEFEGTCENRSAAIFNMLERCKASEHLAELTDYLIKSGEVEQAQLQRSSWGVLMHSLEIMAGCFDNLNNKDFSEFLFLLFKNQNFGGIPATLDQVVFGSADRIKPSRPKITFVIGAAAGVFPKPFTQGGVLTALDRMKLESTGITIGGNVVSAGIDERFLFYNAVSSATDEVFISYPLFSDNGVANEPSIELTRLAEGFKKLKSVSIKSDDLCDEFIQSSNAAFERLAANYDDICETTVSLKKCLMKNSNYSQRIKAIQHSNQGVDCRLSKETAKKLFGKNLYLSASKIDNYFHCAFSYFCRYGIKAKPKRKAELDNLVRGSLVHYVLEQIISSVGDEICRLSSDEITNMIDKHVDGYFLSVSANVDSFDDRMKYMINILKQLLFEICEYLSEDMKQSDFKPVRCELKISDDGEVSPLILQIDDARIIVNGEIDRVDIFNDGSRKFVRIIDYKTGKKRFAISQTLYGINLQMLLYLYILLKNGRGELEDLEPAGILYMPAKRPKINDNGLREWEKMNGMLVSDTTVLSHMENGLQGKFIPVSLKKDGEFRKGSSVVSSEEFGTVFDYIEKMLKRMALEIYNGDLSVNPIDVKESSACKYCDYAVVCGKEHGDTIIEKPDYGCDEVLTKMSEVIKGGV